MTKHTPTMRLLRFGVRGMICLATATVVLLGYSFASRHAIRGAILLPVTPLDRAVPLVTWTVWVYHLLGIGIAIGWFYVPNTWLARRLFLGVMVSTVVCMAVFVFFPTARYVTALPGEDSVSRWALATLWKIDDPTNCLPSLHVTLATCVALTMREFGTTWVWRRLPAAWGIAIALSTLTTKQHYVLDVVAGAFLGWCAYAVVKWAARADLDPFWCVGGASPIRLADTREQSHLDKVRAMMAKTQWSLDDLPTLETNSNEPLPPAMVRFLNQVIYVEYLAAMNFEFLARATTDDPNLREVYERFGVEERQHAEGLRRLLRANGADLQPPGLGCALLLHQFDALDPMKDADALLVALAIPVFETFLDAGTIPFVKSHPAIASPGLEALIGHICRDESRHLAVNWAVSRAAVRAVRKRRLAGLRLICNPRAVIASIATPFLALDVYANANRLGFDFRKLMPSFRRLFHLHRGYPELARFPLWFGFRIWVACATVVTHVVIGLDWLAPRVLRWLAKTVTWTTDRISNLLFDDGLLVRGGLPALDPVATTGDACQPEVESLAS